MTDKEISQLGEQEFDLYLEEIIDRPPPSDIADDFKPWRKAMNRVLWGIGLTMLTLNVWNLDVILPGIGTILLLLGFRSLRNENKWFKTAYVIAWIRTVWWLTAFFVNATVFSCEKEVSTFLAVGTYTMVTLGFIMLLSLRNGIRTVQKKADLQPHGGNGMLCWYLIIFTLGIVSYVGILAWVLLIAYICILRNLYKLSKELDEAGYAIVPAPVRVSDRWVKILYAAAVAAALVVGLGCFNKYPMNWQLKEVPQSASVQAVRRELLELGFPEQVLDDMTAEEILACDGAVFVLVDQRDYDVDQGRGIGTKEEIAGGKGALVTKDQAEAQLRMTHIGVKLGEDRETWKIIHHFQWLVEREFCGTEALQLLPKSNMGWEVSDGFTGRLLYDEAGATYTSDHHSLGKVTYQTTGLAAQMLGQTSSTDVFATFSMPNTGENHRGYVLYELAEMIDGGVIDSWCNYVHQQSWLQYPVRTALEYRMTTFLNLNYVFKTIQTALQFTTHGEVPELF